MQYRENSDNQKTSSEQELGDSGKENFPFNSKKLPGEPSSARDSHLTRLVGDKGRETGQKMHCGREPEINNSHNLSMQIMEALFLPVGKKMPVRTKLNFWVNQDFELGMSKF